MCGRFTLTTPGSILAESFGVPELQDLGPRYNIAPSQPVACLRSASDPPGAGASRDREGRGEPGRLELAMLRWGLVPHWADDPSIGNRMINARSETVADKPAFRDAFRSRRCLVIADGFYEWKRLDGCKQPYCVRMSDGRPFAFAGLWESWRPPDGGKRPAGDGPDGGSGPAGRGGSSGPAGRAAGSGPAGSGASSGPLGRDGTIESCVVLTAPPNDLLADIHDRMPVILPRERYQEWLDPARSGDAGAALRDLLSPYPAEEMEAYPVSTFVNAPANDAPQCVEPLYDDRNRERETERVGEAGTERDRKQEPERPRTGRLF